MDKQMDPFWDGSVAETELYDHISPEEHAEAAVEEAQHALAECTRLRGELAAVSRARDNYKTAAEVNQYNVEQFAKQIKERRLAAQVWGWKAACMWAQSRRESKVWERMACEAQDAARHLAEQLEAERQRTEQLQTVAAMAGEIMQTCNESEVCPLCGSDAITGTGEHEAEELCGRLDRALSPAYYAQLEGEG
ncbi:MAG: hypothetical protein GY838_13045 [bacterium]|nr:hypothetical protein [bacterium]